MWTKYAKVRTDNVGGLLGDVDSHLPAGHAYKDPDRVTWAHESIHGVNSHIRMVSPDPNAYYLLDDVAYLLGRSKVSLKTLAKGITKDKQGIIFKLYLIDAAQWWNEDAFYILDELSAYVVGAQVAIELDIPNRYNDSIVRARELEGYILHLQTLVGTEIFSGLECMLSYFTQKMQGMEALKIPATFSGPEVVQCRNLERMQNNG